MSNKSRLQKLRQTPFFLWRIAGFLVIVLTFASIIFSIIFVYQYLYNTLDEANSIVVLKSEPDLGEIKTPEYQKDQKLIAVKQSTSTLFVNARNMFGYTSGTTTPNATLNVSSSSASKP